MRNICTLFVCAFLFLVAAFIVPFGCLDDDDDDDDSSDPCGTFCSIMGECDIDDTLVNFNSMDACMAYCQNDMESSVGNCVINSSDCDDVEECFSPAADDDDDDFVGTDPLCPEGGVCVDVRDSGILGCMAGDVPPEDAITGCHEHNFECVGNATCHYTNDAQTESACIENCGECPDTQICMDVDGGLLGCMDDGELPEGLESQCHLAKGACKGNTSCVFINSQKTKSACIQNCSSCTEGMCPEGYGCDEGLCKELPCTTGSCDDGEVCWNGYCVMDTGQGPGAGPGPDCDSLPPIFCDGGEAYCSELIQFDPTEGDGYIDYPENGETSDNQYRSWLRRDLVMLIKYASAKTACKAENFEFGIGGPIGLIDMSEEDGSIPGTSIGSPGHPNGTHTNGFDIDLAYFQTDTPDNRARTVCEHHNWRGGDEYHCTEFPHLLDPWRTAMFIGVLFENPNIRVIGADGKAGPMIDYAMDVLCENGWLEEDACNDRKLTWEFEDEGRGWFRFHHHHIHVSFSAPDYEDPKGPYDPHSECIVPGCK